MLELTPSAEIVESRQVIQVLDSRTKRLDGYAYKLVGGAGYGIDTTFDQAPTVDEKRMSVRLPFASGERRDSVGDLLEVGGIRLDRHRLNPISLLDHGKHQPIPIGLCAEWDEVAEKYDVHHYTVEIDQPAQTAWSNIFFYRGKGAKSLGADGAMLMEGDSRKEHAHAILCEQTFHWLATGLLRGGSIGYAVITAKQLEPDYAKGLPQGLHLLSVMMLEASVVVMPANMDTTIKLLAMPLVCGKPTSPYLVKTLQQYAPEKTKTVTGYEGKGDYTYLPQTSQVYGYNWNNDKTGANLDIDTFESPDQAEVERHRSAKKAGGYSVSNVELRYKDKKDLDGKSQITGDLDWLKEEQAEAEHKAVPVPLAKLPDGKVPPARWKPGAGATCKELRAKYGVKAKRSDKLRDQDQPNVLGYDLDRQSLTPKQNFIDVNKPGDYGADPLGDGKFRMVPSGDVVDFDERNRRLGQKSLDPTAIRKKYTPAKALRRRLKSSRPGSSVVRVRGKDLEALRSKAADRGVVVKWMGDAGDGTSKVKLTGDDGVIDGLAREHGLAVRRKGLDNVKSWTGSVIHIDRHTQRMNPGKYGKRGFYATVFDDSKPAYAQRLEKIGPFDTKAEAESALAQALTEKNTGSKALTNGDGYTEASALLREYLATGKAEHRRRAWELLIGAGVDLVGVSADRRGAEYLLDHLHAMGTKKMGVKSRDLDEDDMYGRPIRQPASRTYKASYVVGGKRRQFYVEAATFSQAKQDAERTIREIAPAGTKLESLDIDSKSLRNGAKGMNGTKTKDLPPEADLNNDGVTTEQEYELYSAQVIRRLHEDALLLLQHYHDLGGPLEHEPTKKLLEKKLEALVADLDELEGHFSEHHPDANPLAGTEDKGLDEEEMAQIEDDADSDVEAEAPTEDAVEGMEAGNEEAEAVNGGEDEDVAALDEEGEKSLVIARTKAIRQGYKKKAAVAQLNKAIANGKPAAKAMPGCKGKCSCGGKCANCKKAKALTTDEAEQIEGDLDDVADELKDEVTDTEPQHKGLEPHHVAKVGEAAGFLNELSTTHDFHDEHRMKSFHYHKSLDDVKDPTEQLAGAPTPDDTVPINEPPVNPDGKALPGEPGMEPEGAPSDQMEGAPNAAEMEHRTKMAGCYKAVKAASSYFKDLSGTHDYGDVHRSEALIHAKALGAVAEMHAADQDVEVNEPVPGADEPMMPSDGAPGAMGEKKIKATQIGKKALNAALKVTEDGRKLDEQCDALARRLDRLQAVLT